MATHPLDADAAATLLPRRPAIDHTPRDRWVIDLVDEESTAALDALGSETARRLLAALADAPATASDLAATSDTSLQNVQYHLAKLLDAGLVVDVGSWTSTKGRAMTVYAPASRRVELRLSDDHGETMDRTVDERAPGRVADSPP